MRRAWLGFLVIMVVLFAARLVVAQTPTPASSSSSSSGAKSLKNILPGSAKARNEEERILFKSLKEEVRTCVGKEFEKREKTCYKGKFKKGQPVIDKKCRRIEKVKSEIQCEKDIKRRVPYKSRPQWDAYRAKKMARDQKQLDKLLGRPTSKGQKGSKNSADATNEDEWVKEFE